MRTSFQSTSLRRYLFAISLAAASGSLLAATDTDRLGNTAQGTPVNREIVIDASTRWVNIERDEKVRFINTLNGQQFEWQFSTVGWPVFQLSRVAPNLLGDKAVTVYVGRNEFERNSCGS